MVPDSEYIIKKLRASGIPHLAKPHIIFVCGANKKPPCGECRRAGVILPFHPCVSPYGRRGTREKERSQFSSGAYRAFRRRR